MVVDKQEVNVITGAGRRLLIFLSNGAPPPSMSELLPPYFPSPVSLEGWRQKSGIASLVGSRIAWTWVA